MNNHQRNLGLAVCALALAACTGEGRAGSPAEGPNEDEPTAEVSQQVLTIDADGLRFLEQATFGATPSSLTAFGALGATPADRMNAWINAQVALPASHFTAGGMQNQFFNITINGQDQLRQRVAFALSQIFVTSLVKLKDEPWMEAYANKLIDGAFGNFKDLLVTVAESQAMGYYLDNANNFVVDTAGNPIAPNENFARELMQLFTVGLCELKPNGTLQGGVCTPPYDQANVKDYAHLMSGWTFDTNNISNTGTCPAQVGKKRSVSNAAMNLPMLACNTASHDYTQRTLLNRFDPANVYQNAAGSPTSGWSTRDAMEKPLDSVAHTSGVIADLFNHPNVGPFIGKQLIQHLVTSNPTSAYVARITAVFGDDGTAAHARGNLQAVVKAILTDAEARDLSPGVKFGHLREPVLYLTSVMRLVAATPDGTGLSKASAEMGQDVFYSPSVFNYYPASYPVPTTLLPAGSGQIVAGEFGIEDTSTVLTRTNFMDVLLYTPTALSATLSLSLGSLPTDPLLMIDWCNAYMMHNKMTADMKTTLTTALDPLSVTGDAMKKRAIYLVATSSQFQIER